MRVPFTLWRSMLVDLWRLIALSTTALVVVIAFALTVKFFADGKLSPVDMLKFMGLAFIPMLQYALPFAAGFSATITYHRMMNDNEVSAAYASGISRLAVLAPALVTGLLMAAILTGLVQVVIPGFLYRMESLVRMRVASAVENAVAQGEPIVHENTMIYADAVRSRTPPPDSGADAELLLMGVVVVELDDEGGLTGDTSASLALVRVYAGAPTNDGEGSGSLFRVWAEDAVVTRNGMMANVGTAGPWEWRVPGTFSDDPEFLPFWRLVALHDHPDWMSFIRLRKRDLAFHMAEREATSRLNAELAERNRATLVSSRGDQTCVIHGSRMTWDQHREQWRVWPTRDGVLEVERVVTSSGSYTRFVPESIWLHSDIGHDLESRRLAFRLTLEGVVDAYGASGDLASTYDGREFPDLRSDWDFVRDFDALTSPELLRRVQPLTEGPNADPFLVPPTRELRARLARLDREIMGQMHERSAYAVACLVMVMCGAVTAMRLSRSTPLVVYLWSFFPALFTVITMSAGEEATQELGRTGLVMLWGVVGVLTVYTVLAARVGRGR